MAIPETMTAEIRGGALMERILILDDDAANMQGIGGVLRSEQYSVLEASNGLQAMENEKNCGPISLLVTDMDLPESSGTDIALKLVALHPSLPVLFISGTPRVWWTRRDVANFERFAPTRVDFLEKPFFLSQLLVRVRDLIGRASCCGKESGMPDTYRRSRACPAFP